jgi:hypothetical protein
MFHYFIIPYFTCTFFIKSIYNEYIGPYFLSHIVSKIFTNEPPEFEIEGDKSHGQLYSHGPILIVARQTAFSHSKTLSTQHRTN